MKNTLTKIYLRLAFYALGIFVHCSLFTHTFAQGVGINTSGSSPSASAALDVDVANKGILIPRAGLTSDTDVTTITSPTTSLLVYNTNAAMLNGNGSGFYYWDGSQWLQIGSGANNGNWDISYPDGFNNVTHIAVGNLSVNPYTVPSGKNLYITNYYSKQSSGNEKLKIDGLTVYGPHSNESGYALVRPLVAGTGSVITSTNTEVNTAINGFLVNAGVTPVTVGNLGANPYTVPLGKTLFLMNYYSKQSSGNEKLKIDGITVYGPHSNESGYALQIPLQAGPGSVVTSTNTEVNTGFNGYLK